MADILIPRMILPKEGERYYLTIDHNGDVCRFVRKKPEDEPKYVPYATAIELPPHGRLVLDTDVKALVFSGLSFDKNPRSILEDYIDKLPTVLEASK